MSAEILEVFETEQCWKGNPLAVHIGPFAIRLIEDGYKKNTIR